MSQANLGFHFSEFGRKYSSRNIRRPTHSPEASTLALYIFININ
jgi:hypothetical protein